MLSGMVHSEYFQSFPGAPEGTAGPVCVASAFTLTWLLSLLLLFAFFSVPKIFRGKHISFFVCPCVFCFYFCVFLPLLYSLAVIFIFFNVWVEAVQRRSSTPGKCHKSNVCKTGNTPLIQPAEYNDTAGFNLVLSVIY